MRICLILLDESILACKKRSNTIGGIVFLETSMKISLFARNECEVSKSHFSVIDESSTMDNTHSNFYRKNVQVYFFILFSNKKSSL